MKVEYDNIESLAQSLQDLETRKNGVAKQAEMILESRQLSKKGLARVIRTLNGYPKVGKPLVDADEGALLSLLMEIKQHQISMMVIVDAINTLQTKGEQ